MVQLGGAAAIAVLGTIFFTALSNPADARSALHTYSDAFAAVLPVEMGLYLVAAVLMLALPRAAARTAPDAIHHAA